MIGRRRSAQSGLPTPLLSLPKTDVRRAKIKIFAPAARSANFVREAQFYAGSFPDSGSFIRAYSTRGEWPKSFL